MASGCSDEVQARLLPPSKAQIQDFEHACARDSLLCSERKSFHRDFIGRLSSLVQSQPPVQCSLEHQPGQKENEKYSVKITLKEASLGQPCSVSRSGDVDFTLTPQRCRLENLTYSAPMYVKILVETEEPSAVGPIFKGSSHRFYLTDIPVMVDNKPEADGESYENGEIDDGAYYLLKGKERIIPMQRSTDRYATVAYKKEEKNLTCVVIRSGGLHGKTQSTRLNFIPGETLEFNFWRSGGPKRPAAMLRGLGLQSPLDVLSRMGPQDTSFFGSLLTCEEDESDEADEATEERAESLFPGTDIARKPAAVVSAIKMIRFTSKTDFYTERDSVISQTVEGVSEVLTTVFERALSSTMKTIKQRMENHLRKIHNLRTDKKKHRLRTVAMPTAKTVSKCMFRFNNIGTRMVYFIGTGNLVGGGDSAGPRVGLCQMLERTSRLQKESAMQKIITGLDAMNAPTSAREFSLCSLGRICMVSTPEGKRCGLVGQRALGARVSRDRKSSLSAILGCVSHLMVSCSGREGALQAIKSTAVWASGVFVGLTDQAVALTRAVRSARRDGQIPRDVGISLHGDGTEVVWVEIRVHAGRLLRPLTPLDKHRPPMPVGTTWSRYISEGYIEMLDAREEMTAFVAQMATVATERHTHREVFHAASLGCVPSCIPFLDHEPVPRASYFTNQAQQTIGHDPRNFANRMTDAKSFQMWYPQRSLVNTSFEESSKADYSAPQGQNVCIAILSLQGCEEDAILVSKAAVERGLFRCTEYSVKTITSADRKKKCFAHPQRKAGEFTTLDKPEWAALGLNTGIAQVGKRVRTGDALVGLADAKRVKTVNHGAALPAVVDQVLIFDEHTSGHRTAKIRLRTDRPLAVGDKLASRFSQKGITSKLVSAEDLPWLEDGSGAIDIIVNPCFLPSRMTIGQLMEHLCGFACSVLGMPRYDASAFAHSTLSVMKDLESKGFKGNAKWLRCPITGERLPNKVEIGIAKYHRLNKFASDKMRVRTTGKRDLISFQPCSGRNSGEKALRVGGMETTALASHGGAFMLNDASRDRSDGTTFNVCSKCGNTHFLRESACPLCGSEPTEIQSTTATLRMLQIFEGMNISMELHTKK